MTPEGEFYVLEGEVGKTARNLAVDHMVPGMIGECGGTCSCGTCHVLVDSEWIGVVGEVEEGGLDIFVANAAMEMNEPVIRILDESIDPVVETNFASSVVLTREFAKPMAQRGWGRIIYISSATAYKSTADGHSIYAEPESLAPVYAAAHGPKLQQIASEKADGILT